MTDESPAGPEAANDTAQSGIDTTVPHSARIWNYWLGGKDNFAVDRAAGDAWTATFPGLARHRPRLPEFLTRSIAYLAEDAGIRQFLDVGTGLPTADNTHQVAQRVAPQARIVYVDNDPLVLAHARALLTSTPEGATAYIHADLRDPDKILAEAADTLDFTQPIGLILAASSATWSTSARPARSCAACWPACRPAATCPSTTAPASSRREELEQATQDYNDSGALPYVQRTPEEIASFFEGLELVEPGVVSCPRWRPDPAPGSASDGPPAELDAFGGIGRKP